MMQSGVPLCNTCGEQVGLNDNGEAFVACHGCSFPICKDCFEHEINEGHRACLRCGTPYEGNPLTYTLYFQVKSYCLCCFYYVICFREIFRFSETMEYLPPHL